MNGRYMQANIYIHTDKSRESIVQELALLLQSNTYKFHVFKENLYNIYVKINKGGYDYKDSIIFPNFHDFCYYLEYTPEENLDKKENIKTVTSILEFFWQNNIPAVADCEYSEELPLNGGYSEKAPWPS